MLLNYSGFLLRIADLDALLFTGISTEELRSAEYRTKESSESEGSPLDACLLTRSPVETFHSSS